MDGQEGSLFAGSIQVLTRNRGPRLRKTLQDLRRLTYDERHRNVLRWKLKRGDKTLRLDYPLGPGSVVLDLGGYVGEWTAQIVERYGCTVHVFEPVPNFADRLEERFEHCSSVFVHRFGLSDTNKEVDISLSEESSSVFSEEAGLNRLAKERVRLVSAKEFLSTLNVEFVDLMKINIEGGEYDLLGHLLEEGLIERFGNIQVQFHEFVPDAKAKMEQLQSRLTTTHSLTYQTLFVWENWCLREG